MCCHCRIARCIHELPYTTSPQLNPISRIFQTYPGLFLHPPYPLQFKVSVSQLSCGSWPSLLLRLLSFLLCLSLTVLSGSLDNPSQRMGVPVASRTFLARVPTVSEGNLGLLSRVGSLLPHMALSIHCLLCIYLLVHFTQRLLGRTDSSPLSPQILSKKIWKWCTLSKC